MRELVPKRFALVASRLPWIGTALAARGLSNARVMIR
jgi:hypothetical protein